MEQNEYPQLRGFHFVLQNRWSRFGGRILPDQIGGLKSAKTDPTLRYSSSGMSPDLIA